MSRGSRVAVRSGIVYFWRGREDAPFGRGRDVVSANDGGSGTGIWGMTRLVAPALAALALAGVALPWILDAGTVRLPAIGVGVSTGSASGPPAVAKVEVTAS